MTTKTQAAKAFAATYGTYSALDSEYRLDFTRGTQKTNSYYERYREQDLKNDLTEQRARADAQKRRADQAIADLQAVMRLLGVDERYEEDVETYYERTGYYSDLVTPRKRVTKTALTKFREDIRAVDKATDAAAALDRLTGGSL